MKSEQNNSLKTTMKTSHAIITSLALCSTLLFVTASVHAQGALTPPVGAPGPVMKTLSQVEPRTPLVIGASGVTNGASSSFVITKPGSYYLTENLVVTSANNSGIDLGNQDVVLDLNGFSIIKTNGLAG